MVRTNLKPDESTNRWRAIVDRFVPVDDPFVYAVRTTGIYCRPGCRSRLPNQKNVEYFDTSTQAEAAGYRPCRRCRPNEHNPVDATAEQLARACRFIDGCETSPRLAAIADHVGLSSGHVHRLFRKHLGISPRGYAAARRSARLRNELEAGRPLSRAIFAAGYESSGRCYADARATLGMTPGNYLDRGRKARIRFAITGCTFGRVLVAVTNQGVCRITLGDNDVELVNELRAALPNAQHVEHDRAFAELLSAVVDFVERPTTPCSIPLDIRGTAFQRRVWEALTAIPVGQTRSYAELARLIDQPAAARAVASACAANPVAIAVPCHRAVRGDGTIGGYRWGLNRKKILLARESELVAPLPGRRRK